MSLSVSRSLILMSKKTLTASLVSLSLLTAPLLTLAADPHAAHQAEAVASTAAAQAPTASASRTIQVVVDRGYKADSFEVKEGESVRLTFVRKEYTACTKEVVFPALGIRKELPVGEPVTIELPPQKAGEV